MAGAGRIARAFGNADLAARLAAESTPPVAGYLPYNPGPGIYSRLERAIEQMPENVRVQELPGLLKRYKDGVPGWELKETDLDSIIAGRDVVPRSELLARVQERSPVYTHREIVLTGGGPVIKGDPSDDMAVPWDSPDYQDAASRIGQGIGHGDPKYGDYGQGGDEYTEILLTQPGARDGEYGNHWNQAATAFTDANRDAVAHARFDVHDGYLRVNELQSDLGIHNRKQREYADQNPQIHFGERLNPPEQSGLPFPLEDAWADLLLKRLNLYAAQRGLKGVEIASPRAIADRVGGNISNYEHAYGKVAVGNQQRLGRKLGGMAEDTRPHRQASDAYEQNLQAQREAYDEPYAAAADLIRQLRGGRISSKPQSAFDMEPTPLERFDALDRTYQAGMGLPPRAGAGDLDFEMQKSMVRDDAERLYVTLIEDLVSRGIDPGVATRQATEAMPQLVRLAEEQAARNASFVNAQLAPHGPPPPPSKIVYRGTMSDEMRRRLIQQGVGASLLAPLLLQEEAP